MGWGLVFVVILAASPFIYRDLLGSALDILEIPDIQIDQFRITNGNFKGLDSKNNPYHIQAEVVRQLYENQDTIFLEGIRADIIQVQGNTKTPMKIKADRGEFTKSADVLVLTGNVFVDSQGGDKVNTQRLVIQMKNKK
jgi:LPS export ABC transporter protein LptC